MLVLMVRYKLIKRDSSVSLMLVDVVACHRQCHAWCVVCTSFGSSYRLPGMHMNMHIHTFMGPRMLICNLLYYIAPIGRISLSDFKTESTYVWLPLT
jgi:hypothetical protein